ncbi:MAG TPA: GNAT family N-acetyltransferase [Microscillaceae bacterium]|nr:GNAT family N-acetyltransferase [Microscillaceae bacterium]
MKNQTTDRSTTLQKGKVMLRTLQETDARDLARHVNNKKIWDNLRDYIPFPYTEEDAKSFIASVANENPVYTFVITYEGQVCGVMGLVAQQDVYKKSASIGYWVSEDYWGKGIASTALELATHYGLYQLGHIRIDTSVFEYNPASMRVLEKNGYVKEGIFRKAIFKNNQIWDEHRYAIVRED